MADYAHDDLVALAVFRTSGGYGFDKLAGMQREDPDALAPTEMDPTSVEWMLARIEEMAADRLAGKFPEDRETILVRLGYGDYESYLLSPLWRKIRRRILKRGGFICVRCGDRATHVHHLAYTQAVLKGDDDSELVSGCAPCHKKVEFDESGGRRPEHDRRRVLEDSAGARQERIVAERSRQEKALVRDAADGRCFWCNGCTEQYPLPSSGSVYSVPTADGQAMDAWMCAACRLALERDAEGQAEDSRTEVGVAS